METVKVADHTGEHKGHLRWFDVKSPILHTPPLPLSKSTFAQTITAEFRFTGIRGGTRSWVLSTCMDDGTFRTRMAIEDRNVART